MQPLTHALVGAFAVILLVSMGPRAGAADGANAGRQLPSSPSSALSTGDDIAAVPEPPVQGGNDSGGKPEDPGESVRPEPPPAAEVGTLLKAFNEQRRWERQVLAEKTRNALTATRTVSRSERNRVRSEVLAQAGVDRETLLAAQREARTAMAAQLEDLRSNRREHQDLVEAAKERGLEASHARHGASQD
ncbi:MAG: hypothetical protein IT581_16705 [Verrucomicrobiales bacterium]|nr:hypothetical protein [Verrucomicrobiales bacterium]